MTIAALGMEIGKIIKDWHVYGLEALINAIVRATINEPYIDADYIKKLVDTAYERETRRYKL